MKSDEPYGEAALMLCESLLHLLVDEGLIAKEKALEALEGVAELAGERPENDARREQARLRVARGSDSSEFQAKGLTPGMANPSAPSSSRLPRRAHAVVHAAGSRLSRLGSAGFAS
jgi:hypothetical protein